MLLPRTRSLTFALQVGQLSQLLRRHDISNAALRESFRRVHESLEYMPVDWDIYQNAHAALEFEERMLGLLRQIPADPILKRLSANRVIALGRNVLRHSWI